jgi:hypothetical protein
LSEQKENDKGPDIRYEGGVPILEFRRQLNEVERKQAEAERRDAEYKERQIALNKWLAGATVALVICTVALGGIQIRYMHRQWKLTSASLSKMGDQIWAAKDAAYAAQSAAGTAAGALSNSETSLRTTIDNFRLEQRAWVYISSFTVVKEPSVGEAAHIKFMVRNNGRTPAIFLRNQEGATIWTSEPPRPDWSKVKIGYPSDLSPGDVGFVFDAYSLPVSEVAIDGYKAHTTKMYVRGRITYLDAFGHHHWVEACAMHSFGDPRNAFQLCRHNNDMDQDYK